MMTQEPCKSSWKTPWKLLSTGAVSLTVQDVWNHTVIVIEFKIVGLERIISGVHDLVQLFEHMKNV